MRIVRYILFLPAAIIASLIAGAFSHWLGEFGFWIYDGSLVLAWALSGLGSSLAFVFVGLQVAPEPTERIKYLLLGVLGLLGTISTIGPFLFGGSLLPAIAGVVMLFIATAFVKYPAIKFVR